MRHVVGGLIVANEVAHDTSYETADGEGLVVDERWVEIGASGLPPGDQCALQIFKPFRDFADSAGEVWVASGKCDQLVSSFGAGEPRRLARHHNHCGQSSCSRESPVITIGEFGHASEIGCVEVAQALRRTDK
jgi:hypothetical protein